VILWAILWAILLCRGVCHPAIRSDQTLQTVLANVTLNMHPVTKYGAVPTCETNVVELLAFKIVSGEFDLAHIADHRFGFLDHLPCLFVFDHQSSSLKRLAKAEESGKSALS
jgi:hypothetical protein